MGPTDIIEPIRGDQNLSAGQPVAGVNHQVADRPGLIIGQKIFHMADLAVDRLNVIPVHLLNRS